jgi:lactoylglutathione lyase
MLIKILGFCAAILTTTAYVPQAVKTWRTKSTRDISFWMFLLLFTGLIFWLLYGIFIHDFPIIIANAVTLFFAGIILFYIIKPGKELRIEHIAIWVNDLENQKNFYCTNFNGKASQKYINKSKNFSSYFISLGTGVRLELMNKPEQSCSPSKNHFALSAGSKKRVDSLTESLRNKGVLLVSLPRYTGDGYYESVFQDPEGNLIEITI